MRKGQRHFRVNNPLRLQIRAEIKALRMDFRAECDQIAKECEEEGYPSHGSIYELRCSQIWENHFEDELQLLYEKLDIVEGRVLV